MVAEAPKSELTTTLHLTLREVSNSPANRVEEIIAGLPAEDREVIAAIQASNSEKSMVIIARGPNKGSRFLITSEGVAIGRASGCDIFLDDITVSRQHAKISKVGSDFVLTDEGSLNGTYFENESISKRTLLSGDEFQIGKFHLLFIGSN
jgi:pSer/pThr/pTyr-binding forkhead associated (FHA) protein